MKNVNMNGQNIRKTVAAAIAAMTMVLTTSCGSVSNIVPSSAVPAAQTTVQSAETTAAETEAPAEKEVETAAEKKEASNELTDKKEENKDTKKSEKKDDKEPDKKEDKKDGKPAAASAKPAKPSSNGGSSDNKPAQNTNTPEHTGGDEYIPYDLDNMNVYELMGYSIADLVGYSDYSIMNDLVGFQGSSYIGIVLDKYPQYAFIPSLRFKEECEIDASEDILATGDNRYIISKYAAYVNAFNGAYIGSARNGDIVIGMSYNDIKSALGEDFGVYVTNDSCGICGEAYLNGRIWRITFDLTQEQRDEIFRRQQELAGEEVVNCLNSSSYSVDISDMDPTSCAAVAETFN